MGWAVGSNNDFSDGGVILKTIDGGKTWTTQYSTSGSLTSIHFLDQYNGWVVGEYGIILRTTNGGTNWIQQNSPINDPGYGFESVYFVNPNTGWVIPHTAERVYKTTDGSKNWIQQNCPITSSYDYFFSSYFINMTAT